MMIMLEWVSGDRSENITWSTDLHASSIYHAVTASIQHPYEEFGAQANWGTVYYATQQVEFSFGENMSMPFNMYEGIRCNPQSWRLRRT